MPLSRRDGMKVAWQFTARNVSRRGPRPVGYGVIGSEETSCTLAGEHASRPTQTVPYGTGPLLNLFLAVNCQATIT